MAIIASLVFILMLANGQLAFASSKHDLSDIESFMDGFLQEKVEEESIPNMVVTVVSNGEVIFEKGYGYANIEDQIEVDPETSMFRIGSVSKLFTWTAVMQLVEEGKLDLNADINEYLDFDIPAELAVGENEENLESITLLNLMTHTPGFEDYASSIIRLEAKEMPPLDEYVRENLPERVFPPGEVIAYSNYGTALAGYIVERVSGMDYSDYVEEKILKQLDMNYSTFEQPVPAELSDHLVQAYRYVDGEFKKGKFEFMPKAAGGASSSGVDMAKFMQAYLDGGSYKGNRILEKATVDHMFEQQFTHHPKLDGMTLGFMERNVNGQRIIQHGGNTSLFDAGLYLLPDENIGIFVAYSGNNILTHSKLFQAFMDHYFPAEESMDETAMLKTDSTIYAGEYHQNRKSFTNSDKITSLIMGKILVQADDSGDLLVTINREKNRFVPIQPGVYKNTREGSSPDPYGNFNTIVFQTDPHGNVLLTTDGPMSYSKAPWYASTGFTFLSLIFIILLFVGSLLYWGIRRLLRRKRTRNLMDVFGKGLAITAGILLLLLVVGIAATGGMDPIYSLPKEALGLTPAWTPLLDVVHFLLVVVGITMILFVIRIWWKSAWGIGRTLHYSLLSLALVHLFWIFWYWNLF